MYDITSLRRCPVVNRSLEIIRKYRDVNIRDSPDSILGWGGDVFQKKIGTFTFELQIILKNLENFIKGLNSYFFDFKKRIQYLTVDRCDDTLDSTEVRIEDVS